MEKQTPLGMMLELMLEFKNRGEFDKAATLARYAAPYMHGKIGAARGGGHLSEVSDDELEAYFGFGEGSADEGPDAAG